MSFLMQCPFCPAQIKLPETAQVATCPQCSNTFRAIHPEEAAAIAAEKAEAEAHAAAVAAGLEEPDLEPDPQASVARPAPEALLPPWVGVWGFAALLLGGLALLLAPLPTVPWLTITLAGLGLVSAGVGIAKTAKNPQAKDIAWLAAGGFFSFAVLAVTLSAPGMLNRYWTMDGAVARADPHKLIAVTKQGGRVLAPEDLVDAETEAIGQDDVVVRLMSVGAGPVQDRGGKSFLLIHLRLASSGQERGITFAGFGADKHRPTLKDGSGKSYPFLEQRPRKVPAGGLVFQSEAPRTVEIRPMQFLDYQLVFETPADLMFPVFLELPTPAWNRKGVCKFRISGPFEPSLPGAVNKKN
jgi:hypothetical protein